MKKFQTPAIQVEQFDVEDIMTASNPSGGNGPEMPDDEF